MLLCPITCQHYELRSSIILSLKVGASIENTRYPQYPLGIAKTQSLEVRSFPEGPDDCISIAALVLDVTLAVTKPQVTEPFAD